MAGAVAAVAAHCVTYPNDTVRRRMQLQGAGGAQVVYASALECLRGTVRTGGVGALYAGMTVTVARSMPNAAIQFGVYEACKDAIRRARPDDA